MFSGPLRFPLQDFLVRVFGHPFYSKEAERAEILESIVFRTFDIEKIDFFERPFVPGFQIGTDNAKIII